MNRTLLAIFVLVFAALPALAQEAPKVDRVSQMQQIAQSLGVQCAYCHSAARGSGEPEPKKEIARAMMAMTDDINARISRGCVPARARGRVTDIQCAYCHRGVPVPRPIGDIVWQTTREKGVAAAIEQYRDLRQHFYGRSTYDFGEDTLIAVANQMANARADDAIALMRLRFGSFIRSRCVVIFGAGVRADAEAG